MGSLKFKLTCPVVTHTLYQSTQFSVKYVYAKQEWIDLGGLGSVNQRVSFLKFHPSPRTRLVFLRREKQIFNNHGPNF